MNKNLLFYASLLTLNIYIRAMDQAQKQACQNAKVFLKAINNKDIDTIARQLRKKSITPFLLKRCFHYATKHNLYKIATLLYNASPCIYYVDPNDTSALYWAIKHRRALLVYHLIKRYRIDKKVLTIDKETIELGRNSTNIKITKLMVSVHLERLKLNIKIVTSLQSLPAASTPRLPTDT